MAKAKRLSRKQYIKWLQSQGESREPMTREVAYQILDGQLHLLRPDEVDSSLVDDCLDYLYPDRAEKEYPDMEKTWQHILEKDGEQRKNQTPKSHFRRLRPALVIAIVALMILTIGTTVCYALGINLWDIAVSWANDKLYINLSYTSEAAQGLLEAAPFGSDDAGTVLFAGQYDLYSYALTENGIKVTMPQWMPEGFANSLVSVSISDTYAMFSGDYVDEGGRDLRMDVEWFPGMVASEFERNEDEEPVIIHQGEIDFWMFHNVEQSVLVWVEEPYMLTLQGDLTEEELRRMIDSMSEEQRASTQEFPVIGSMKLENDRPVSFVGMDDTFTQTMMKYGLSPRLPKWVPDGCTAENGGVTVSFSEDFTRIGGRYIVSGDRRGFTVNVEWSSDSSALITWSGKYESTIVQKGDIDFTLYSSEDMQDHYVQWVDGQYQITIYGSLSRDELLRMAESIFEE